MKRVLSLLAIALASPLFAADPAPTALTATRIGQTISVLAPSGLSNALAHARASTSYIASDTSIVLETGGGARFATPPFPAQWWNVTDYLVPDDDPYMEWVNVTAAATDTWTVTRAQRGTPATDKDKIGRTYMFLVGSVQKLTGDVLSTLGTVTSVGNGTIGPLFSASWATATATPALSLNFTTQAANCLLAGPATGANAVPTCRAAVALDLGTTLAPTFASVNGAQLGGTADSVWAGLFAASSNAGASLAAIGAYAGYLNVGADLTATGYAAGYSNTGAKVTVTGMNAATSNTGANVTAIGFQPGQALAIYGRYAPLKGSWAVAGAGGAGSVGVLARSYRVLYTLDGVDTELGTGVLVFAASAGFANLSHTAIPIYSGPMTCTARKLYKKNPADSLFYLVTTIADNSTTTYSDTQADATFGAVAATPSNTGNFGSAATTWGANELALGSSLNPFQTIYLNGAYHLTPATAGLPVSIYGMGGNGTDQAGGNVTVGSGRGTGAGAGSIYAIQVPKVAGTGTGEQTETAAFSAQGNASGVFATWGAVGGAVSSGTTITPTGNVFHVTGVTTIQTINLPYTGFVGPLVIIPDGVFVTGVTGNIALASTTIVGKALVYYYDVGTTKFYPSY